MGQTIYISYCWKGPSESIVQNWLCKVLDYNHIEYIIDKKDCGFGDNIGAFERQLGLGNKIILVISRNYMLSASCLYEISQIYKNGDFDARVIPIFIEDFERGDVQLYQQVCVEIENKIDFIKHQIDTTPKSYIEPYQNQLNKYLIIREYVQRFWEYLSDTNTLDFVDVSANDFELVITKLKEG